MSDIVEWFADENVLTPEREKEIREKAYAYLSLMKMCHVLPDRRLARLIKSFPMSSYTKNRPYP